MDLMRDAPLAEQARAQEGDIHADQACETDLKEEGKIVRHIVTLQVDVAESEGKDENAHWVCRRPHADRKHEQAHDDQECRKIVDRKRVVSGKRVSVRLDPGGRRFIKNKKK